MSILKRIGIFLLGCFMFYSPVWLMTPLGAWLSQMGDEKLPQITLLLLTLLLCVLGAVTMGMSLLPAHEPKE